MSDTRRIWLAAMSLLGLLSTTCHRKEPTNIAWAKSYGPGIGNLPVSLHVTNDGGYVLGATVSHPGRNTEMCMIRTG